MNKTPTYKEQFDKLTRAYISGEVDPWDCQACFVGNLLNNVGRWSDCRIGDIDIFMTGKGRIGFASWSNEYRFNKGVDTILEESSGLYTPQEIADIEAVFIKTIVDNGGRQYAWKDEIVTPTDEEALFVAFEATLEFLKQIHISKGEVIDETPVFQKRQLKAV